MFGKKKNAYNSWPKCSECQKMGALTTKGMRHCLTGSCKVQIYWRGGFSEEGGTESNDFGEVIHLSKEDLMSSSLKRKVRTKRDAKMSDILKRYLKK